ncbi:MAG: hypothetical protein ACOYL3_01780 [Desulfuromonadaceae bacterium]
MTKPLLDWLKSPACFDILLKQVAPVICRKADRYGISLDDIGLDSDVNAVASCLWEFLCDEHEKLDDLGHVITTENQSLLVSIIINRFFAYCIDERRSSSTFHAYYQHIRRVLQELHKAGDIQYESNHKSAFYAWSKVSGLTPLTQGILTEGFFAGWPRSEISASDIHKKQHMISLSKFFWHEAIKRLDREHLIPIYDLTEYVARMYGLPNHAKKQKDNCDEDDSNDYFSKIKDVSPSSCPSRTITEQQLEKRADMLSNFWNDKERRLFLLIFDQALTLEEAATKSGYKSAAAVDYHKKKLISAIRESWEQWQFGYSSGDGDVEVEQQFFFEKLIYFCKSLD